MDKIGVISLYGRFNYGNRLQNYAVCEICEHEGFYAESLVLGKRFDIRRETKNFIKKLLGRSVPLSLEDQMDPLRLASFDRFNELIPIRHFDTIPGNLRNEYSYFIVGSDQVWNPRFFAYNEDWYFLRFAEKNQRIALAPSIGLSNLSFIQSIEIAHGVKGISHLSVREDKGADLIKKCTGMDACVICDPTLVVPANKWRSLADDRFTPTTPYIFMYMLGNNSVPSEVMAEITRNGLILVISLTDREGRGEIPAGPAEFLSLIASASHVITDSFHAALFSSVFQVPLTVIRRSGGNEMFSRIETLAEKLGIEDRVYGSSRFDLQRASLYDGVPEAINREREIFMRFFRESVNA